jgi:hypothetical protein
VNDDPDKQDGAGRDEKGRFVPGVSGNPAGRPRSIDFRSLVEQHRGVGIETALLAAWDTLVSLTAAGDVGALKVMLDRICGPVTAKLLIGGDGGEPIKVADRDGALKELASLIATGAARAAAKKAVPKKGAK